MMDFVFDIRITFRTTAIALLIACLFLSQLSCDSSEDNIPVQQVDDQYQLSENDVIKHKQASPLQQQDIYYFGFDLRSSPQEDAAQYLPFLNYLEATTGYQFKLHFTPKNSSAADELGKNITQFASIGATSFLDAQSRYKVVSLVRGLNNLGKAEYQSVLITRPNSSINKIEDLKGRKLAFGSIDSTQGHLIPRIMLSKHNLSLKDLNSYDYTGSHQNCAEAVVAAKFDACGLQDQLGEKLAKQKLVKIIHRSAHYPSSGIAANKDVPATVLEKVKKALIDFSPQGEHKKGLYHWERTEMPRGFVSAKPSDYTNLRTWSVHLGFLKNDLDK